MSTQKELALQSALILRKAGHVVYFAGGAIRDQLLGQTPKDYDLATSARPDEVQALFPRSDAVGKHFGVIIVKGAGEMIEVATFRTDGTYKDGRHPESIEFSSPEKDAQRRDFTINGLFQDPLTEKVIDHVGGRADLAAKLLRAIGNPKERFEEDALRLLRANSRDPWSNGGWPRLGGRRCRCAFSVLPRARNPPAPLRASAGSCIPVARANHRLEAAVLTNHFLSPPS